MTGVCLTALGSRRAGFIATAFLFAFVTSAAPALAEGTSSPTPPPAPAGDKKPGDAKASSKKKKEKKSERQFLDGYKIAYDLIQAGKYDAGIVAMHALGHDEHPDVANYIGYANRKLGHYDEAKVWYEKALAADPKHVRTWQYYGLWHLEQGNRLKAEENLAKIEELCGGTTCKEYVSLKEALNGNLIY
jgi:tetratricopeptide (TPR) repeat protein